ncbi:hypothetical protein [Sorangium sp. Soce836]|nr:hypothetical protein [Sorangium sp. Soce836]
MIAMKMLERRARRVNAVKEDDRDLPARWKMLLDFLGAFRQGGASKPQPAGPAAAEPVAADPAAVAKRDQQPAPGSSSASRRSRSARPVRWRILGVWPVPPRSRTSLPSPA